MSVKTDLCPDEDPGYVANRELARRVVLNDPVAVHHYLSVIGTPIMEHIERTITHRDITAEYYMFLSAPFDAEAAVPRWRPVSLYRGTDCRLSTYTSAITCRHFCKIAAREKKVAENEGQLLDFVDYESLLKCETPDEPDDNPRIAAVRRAFADLPERYRRVLECLVIDKMSALDAWPLLEQYIHPREKDGLTSEQVKQALTPKQRQDALSLVKGYALKRLQRNLADLSTTSKSL